MTIKDVLQSETREIKASDLLALVPDLDVPYLRERPDSIVQLTQSDGGFRFHVVSAG